MRRWITRLALGGSLLVLLAYGAVVAFLALNQASFFYHPDPSRPDLAASRMAGFQEVTLVSADGQRIHGWWSPPRGEAGVVIYFHGNGENRAATGPRLREIAGAGAGVLAIDYRGYGGSTGSPSEAGLYADARAAWSFVARQAPGRPVVLWGESLGTAVATQLATEVDEAGVVLDSPFSSMRSMAGHRMPWVPAELVTHRFDTAKKIARIGSPLILVQCDADRVVPAREGRVVFAAAAEPKQFVVMHGCGHIQIWHDQGKAAILAFLQQRLGTP